MHYGNFFECSSNPQDLTLSLRNKIPQRLWSVFTVGVYGRALPAGIDSGGCGVAQIVAHRLAAGRPEFESRLGTPRGGPLPSGCTEENKSGTLRVVYINSSINVKINQKEWQRNSGGADIEEGRVLCEC